MMIRFYYFAFSDSLVLTYETEISMTSSCLTLIYIRIHKTCRLVVNIRLLLLLAR